MKKTKITVVPAKDRVRAVADAIVLAFMLLIFGAAEVDAQYSPFDTSVWDSWYSCNTAYTDVIASCNTAEAICISVVYPDPYAIGGCINEGSVCRVQPQDTWLGCTANLSADQPFDPFCTEARARRDACYQWLDYCHSLTLDTDGQAICDDGAYYCYVTSGVSQCE